MRQTLILTYRTVRRIAVAIIGTSVVLVGIAMLVLPGPALVVIPAGLAILGMEFAFARRWLRQLKETGEGAILRWRRIVTSDADRKPESHPKSCDARSSDAKSSDAKASDA